MPPTSQSPPLASILVARFLRTNNYAETLNAFIREAGLPADAGQVTDNKEGNNWTIESVLEEKKAFDQTLGFERYGENERDEWSIPGELLYLSRYMNTYIHIHTYTYIYIYIHSQPSQMKD